MFTDIFGFTALMENDEADAMTKKGRYKKVLEKCHQQFNGEIIKDMGDGSLSVFTNSVDAVWCAIEIQKALRANNIPIRIGIHTGNVLFQQGDIMGDAVNIASRMESFAVPGSVFISGKLREEIKNQANIEVVLMGKFELKNVSIPVEIFAVSNDNLVVPKKRALKGKGIQFSENKSFPKKILIGSIVVLIAIASFFFIYKKNVAGNTKESLPKTIAVLPFVNLSTAKDDEYFSDGMCNEIQTQLSKIGALHVISRTTMLQFKDSKKTMKEIGKAVGADVLLEGSVQKANDKLHINMQLIDAGNDQQLWADTYDKDFKDIFSIQSDIAKSVATELKANLTSSERSVIDKRPTENLEAYNLYLKGNYLIQKVTPDDLANGLKMLNQAIALDPKFPLPYLGLAYYYLVATDFYMAPSKALPELKIAAETAIEMDSTLADAYTYVGTYNHWYVWDFPKAEAEYKKAIEFGPNVYIVHFGYNIFLMSTGQTESAKKESARCIELEPMSAEAHAWYGSVFILDGSSMKQLSILIKHWRWIRIIHLPDILKACVIWQRENFLKNLKKKKLADNIICRAMVTRKTCICLCPCGKKQEALFILDSLKKESEKVYVASDVVASVYVALGDKEHAFEYLDKAVNERAGWMVFLNVDPIWDPIRNDPRFIAILHKMGFK